MTQKLIQEEPKKDTSKDYNNYIKGIGYHNDLEFSSDVNLQFVAKKNFIENTMKEEGFNEVEVKAQLREELD